MGDIVFAVPAVLQSLENEQPTQPLSHIWQHSRFERLWERIESLLPWIDRLPPCWRGPSIEITVPDDGGTVYKNGSTSGGHQFTVNPGNPPSALVRADHWITCDLSQSVDSIRWDIRRTSGPTGKYPPKNKWNTGAAYASPGNSAKIGLPDYTNYGNTTYEIRVVALDKNNNKLASDQITYYVAYDSL